MRRPRFKSASAIEDTTGKCGIFAGAGAFDGPSAPTASPASKGDTWQTLLQVGDEGAPDANRNRTHQDNSTTQDATNASNASIATTTQDAQDDTNATDATDNTTTQSAAEKRKAAKLEARNQSLKAQHALPPLKDSLLAMDAPVAGGPHMTEPPAYAPFLTDDNFCCIIGPCKHYMEFLQDDPTALPEPEQHLIRLCHRMDYEVGPLEMTEEAITACNQYRPPWWSVAGWRMRYIVAGRLRHARRAIAGLRRPSDD